MTVAYRLTSLFLSLCAGAAIVVFGVRLVDGDGFDVTLVVLYLVLILVQQEVLREGRENGHLPPRKSGAA